MLPQYRQKLTEVNRSCDTPHLIHFIPPPPPQPSSLALIPSVNLLLMQLTDSNSLRLTNRHLCVFVCAGGQEEYVLSYEPVTQQEGEKSSRRLIRGRNFCLC